MQSKAETNPTSVASTLRTGWITLTALFAVALIVRLYNLGHSYASVDEIQFIKLTEPTNTLFDIFRTHYRQFLSLGQPPAAAMLQSVSLWLLRPISGVEAGMFWLRMPSALWSALAIIPLVRLGSLVAGRNVGIMAGLMSALFFFPVFVGREASYEAAFVMFTAFALKGWFGIAALGASPAPLIDKGLTTLALCAMTTAHDSGMYVALALVVLGFAWTICPPRDLPRHAAGNLALLALAGALAAMPFHWQKLSFESPAGQIQNLSALGIMRDVIGKQFFGTHPLPLGFACLILAAGISASIVWKDGRRHLRIGLLTTLALVGLALAATKASYTLRPFNSINSQLYVAAAIGIFHTLNRLHKHGGTASLALTALLATVSATIFFPALYALPARGVNYGGIARELVATLPRGTPYVMESGYELRFLPGFFATPGLLAACPYLHGDVKELWARQQRFFERYPEAVYVESAHHGSSPNETYGIFEWPRKHFRQRIDVVNEPLARLARLGIWPAAVDDLTAYIQSHTSIYYNTPADNDAVALAEGKKAVVEYPGWKTAEIQQHQYARIAEGQSGTLVIRNLTADYVTGELEIPVGLMAPSTASINVELLQEGISVGAPLPHRGGSFNTMMTGLMRFKPGANIITIRATSGDLSQLKAIVIPGCNFKPR